MKKLFSTLLGISLLSVAYAQDITPLEIGSNMPASDIMMKDVNGKEVSVKGARKDNGLLVMFSCNTCPYVVKSQERTKEMLAFAQKNKIGVIIINSNEAQREEADSYDAMRNYAKEQRYNTPYVVDENSKVADLFGATRTPEVFLFNPKGELMYHGAMEDNPSSPKESKEFYLKNAMYKMVSGEKPDPSETKSIGCTIKRKKA